MYGYAKSGEEPEPFDEISITFSADGQVQILVTSNDLNENYYSDAMIVLSAKKFNKLLKHLGYAKKKFKPSRVVDEVAE